MSCTRAVALEQAPPNTTWLPEIVKTRPARKRWPAIALVLGLTVTAGLLHAAGWLFPGAWPAAWAGQLALISVGLLAAPRRAFLSGTCVGAIGIGLSFYWGMAALHLMFNASPLLAGGIFSALVLWEAGAFGLFAWIVSTAARGRPAMLWVVPCAWAAIEFWHPRVFPWKLGYSQLEVLPLLQIADLAGSTSIGYVMTGAVAAPLGVALSLAWSRGGGRTEQERRAARKWSLTWLFAAALLLTLTLAYGQERERSWSGWMQQQPGYKVALIQVDPAYVGSIDVLRARSLAIHQQVDLLCWPESSLGYYSNDLTDFRDPDRTILLSRDSPDTLEPSKDLACHLLAGGRSYAPGVRDEGPFAMTAFLISPDDAILGRYRKRTLLPFGEYLPGQSLYPPLREWATIHEITVAGTDPAPLVTEQGHQLGALVCYEDTLTANARQTVAAGAQALFSLIQGAAFENPLTLRQHQRLAIMRAVENRRYFVRCASTGITCIIAPTGRVIAELPPQTEGTLCGEIAFTDARTLYHRSGDLFPWLCTIATALGLLHVRRRKSPGR